MQNNDEIVTHRRLAEAIIQGVRLSGEFRRRIQHVRLIRFLFGLLLSNNALEDKSLLWHFNCTT